MCCYSAFEADNCVFRLNPCFSLNIPEVQSLPAPAQPNSTTNAVLHVLFSQTSFLSTIMTNGNPECFKFTLNSTLTLVRLRSHSKKRKKRMKSEIFWDWKDLGHIRGEIWIQASWAWLVSVASETQSSEYTRWTWKGQDLLARCSLLNYNHCSPPLAVCSFLFAVVRVQTPGGRHRLESWTEKGREGEIRRNQPSIFLSAVPPITPSCPPSLSLPPCLLSISVCLPYSLLYPVFSQGWTCVMALLSPPCHPARPI